MKTYGIDSVDYNTPESYIKDLMISHKKKYNDEKHLHISKISQYP
ncbi:hypothetical protein [Lysinibacillus pakistanensis]